MPSGLALDKAASKATVEVCQAGLKIGAGCPTQEAILECLKSGPADAAGEFSETGQRSAFRRREINYGEAG